jgi:CHAD domain-containing protein
MRPSASALPLLAKAIADQLGIAERTASDHSADGIHDLRVSTRRLRAALDLWLEIAPGKKVERARKSLARLGRALGRLREADVDLEELRRLLGEMPAHSAAIEVVMADELCRRKDRISGLEKELRRLDLADFARDTRSEVESVADSAKYPISMSDVARGELRARLPRILSMLEGVLRQPTPVRLHRFRIELKKFRYSVELCAPSYDGRRVGALLDRLKGLQDALGVTQDARAVHDRMAEIRSDLRRDGLGALERSLLPAMRAIGSRLRERSERAVAELERRRQELFFLRFEAAVR